MLHQVGSVAQDASGLMQSTVGTVRQSSGKTESILEAPKRIGDWLLVRKVAEGNWTVVFQARAVTGSSAAAQYAIKLVRPGRDHSVLTEQLLRREVEVAKQVSHPHIVPILAWQLREEPRYLVMPWLPGRSLRELLNEVGKLPLADALWLGRQIAEGLAALHAAGWIHGDLKPDNLVVNNEYHVTLVDLGLCLRPHEMRQQRHLIAGTLNYMAPEWFVPGGRPDFRADFFSLGVIFFEMLCGCRPYSARRFQDLVSVHRNWSLPPLRRLEPCLPTEVGRLLQSLLARIPERRPSSARELVEILARLEIEFFADRRGLGSA